MKKVLAFMLAAMMMASVAVGCGNDSNTSSTESTGTDSTASTDNNEEPSEAGTDMSLIHICHCIRYNWRTSPRILRTF